VTAAAPPAAGGLLAGYAPAGWDELRRHDGGIRPAWAGVAALLAAVEVPDVRRRLAETARLLAEEGVTAHVPGTGERRRWQLDPLPLVIGADDWAHLEAGVAERAELLDLVLADLYGPQELLASGLLPPRAVLGHPGYVPAARGTVPGPSRRGGDAPAGRALVTYAVDVVRDRAGRVLVLADRTQAPSGAAYALQNRVVSSRVLPELHRAGGVQRLAPYFRALREGLRSAAPGGDDRPRTVLLTPGARNETAFEHAFLAARLGLSLVEGADLVVRDGRVWVRALGQLEPVDVILRRLDQEWCDPLELRPDSLIGVPGLLQAVRTGGVAVVNALGAGVLENPVLLARLPAVAERLLGRPLRLPAVETHWLADEEVRRSALADLDRWVFKPVSRRAARGDGGRPPVVVGRALDERGRRLLAAAVAADPAGWVVQPELVPSTAPTLTVDGVRPGRAVLRAFAVADGTGYAVMPGGLTRVAVDDEVRITTGAGALTKDTWVVSDRPEPLTGFWLEPSAPEAQVAEPGVPARAAESLFWLGRYAERAEGVVRLLREVEDRRTEMAGPEAGAAAGVAAAGRACVRALLQALTSVTTTYPGFVGEGAAARLDQPDAELERLAGDASVPGTLAHAVEHLLDAVDAVRDQLSGDTWLVVDDLRRRVALAEQAGGPARGGTGTGDRARILHGLLAIQGLAAEDMVRDAGWHLMDAGRRIERSLQLVALLRATTTQVRTAAADSLVLESVLRVTESILTYRRRYRSQARIATLLDLLLLDEGNPRSLSYQLDLLAEDLRQLPDAPAPGLPEPGRARPAAQGVLDAVLEASTALRAADTGALARAALGPDGVPSVTGARHDLDVFLAHLQHLLRRTGEEVERTWFAQPPPQRPLRAGTSGGRP
jgi:uncharacterized circularly permuted ATP-grasp superfamily protein/uncharacterized alpha-E superfamily protein